MELMKEITAIFGLVNALLLSAVSALQIASLKPIYKTRIDYSYANHFYKESFGIDEPYFPHRGKESVFDARQGVVRPDGAIEAASFEGCGFEVRNLQSQVTDWKDMDEISRVYLPELRSLLSDIFENQITHSFFWYPKLRGEDYDIASGKSAFSQAPVMPLAHIDANLDSYSMEELMDLLDNLIHKNRIYEADNGTDISLEEVQAAIENNQRFLVVNFWKSLGEEPVKRAPLGIYLSRYSSRDESFPTSRPDPDQSRWYTFPEMTRGECLVFKQYDRCRDRPSDLWHCALEVGEEGGEPRRSFDLRAFVLLDEKVSDDVNRFS